MVRRWLQALRNRTLLRRSLAQAVTIAEASQPVVWDRVRDSIFQMDIPQARGYVRARAAAIIRQQAELVLGTRHKFSDRAVARIHRLATERVIHLLFVDLLSSGKEGRRLAA